MIVTMQRMTVWTTGKPTIEKSRSPFMHIGELLYRKERKTRNCLIARDYAVEIILTFNGLIMN
ncbi:hypothetical protein DBV15_02821 [Temnothorax longispinosus]|uniref:Uncharacterized protein n=1 Tax=Temnothorax longispinosus TaxID=300112 RepID=A0A4S2L2I9_9HYME|nr:hypothetical protein DBV15_02821 [Temnothorax longispinosus]